MRTVWCLVVCLVLAGGRVGAQERRGPEVSGYVSDLFSGIYLNLTEEFYWQNTVHNRLNMGWQFAPKWRLDAGMRNRVFAGDPLDVPFYGEGMGYDDGCVDLTWNVVDESDVLFNVAFDRLAITFETDRLCLRLGRQRVNWGQTFVWNPNDLFNAYSFFDFDYIERPGCDAFRGTYYHGPTSFTEVVVSMDSHDDVTAALLHHGLWGNFDYQVMGGMQGSDDWVVGGAFSGYIRDFNVRAEWAYRYPFDPDPGEKGVFEVSLGADYIFHVGEKSLVAQAEVMYNDMGNPFSFDNLTAVLQDVNLSSLNLSTMNGWNAVGMLLYPATSRLNLSASGMYMDGLHMGFAGFMADYSLGSNFDLSFISQYFTTAGEHYPIDVRLWFGYVRLKFSF